MSGCSNHDATAFAEQKLETLKSRVEVLAAEEERKTAILRQLQTRLEEMQKEKESVRQRTREVTADTAAILNELRAAEEVEMLNSMLFEKNTQIILQQLQHDALLQQLTTMETMSNRARLAWHRKGETKNSEHELFPAQWSSCCERLHRHVQGTDRYCSSQQSHLVNHPVSVFHQSVRKMSRTAREREVELAIQLENVDTKLKEASLINDTPRGFDMNRKQKIGELECCNDGVARPVIIKATATEELAELRLVLQQTKELHNSLLLRLKKKGVFPGDGKLPFSPQLVGAAAHMKMPLCNMPRRSQSGLSNASRDGIDLLPLKSVSVLRCSLPSGGNLVTSITNPSAAAAIGTGVNHDDGCDTSVVVVATSDPETVASQLYQYVDSTLTVTDPEVEHLQRQVVAAERDVHRLQQGYETFEEEAKRALVEYEESRKALEAKLCKTREVVEVLQKEKAEWEALQQQMSLLGS